MSRAIGWTKEVCYTVLFTATLVSIMTYLFVRVYLVLESDFYIHEWVLAFVLLFAEAFILVHSIGYFLNFFRVYRRSSSFIGTITKLDLKTFPPVAIVVASYKEPLDILRDTLVCFYNLSYPNKHLYFLDDTRYDLPWDTPENKSKYRRDIEELCRSLDVNLFRANWHGAKAGMINDFLMFIGGKSRPDFEYHHFARTKSSEPEKYLIVFDADMNPFPDFVEYVVDIMEKHPKAAFVQTPQYYTNFEFNRVARSAGVQQAIFYEFICEGKGQQGAMFCCGTNVIFRREALEGVGGFDESSVTEDFATSLKLHRKGWESVYLNRVSAFGLGPEDLGAFFKQQFRWARGTMGTMGGLFRSLISDFRGYTINQWWEYFLASTHYLIGLVFFVMVVYPAIYLFFDIPSYIADPTTYFCTFVPYMTLTLLLFVTGLKKRKYPIKEVMKVLLLNAVSFPVYLKAAGSTLLGLNTKFGVTPKDGGHSLPLWALLPQIATALICISAFVWGLLRLYYERDPFYGILLNVFWTFYNFLLLSSFMYFNQAEEIPMVRQEA